MSQARRCGTIQTGISACFCVTIQPWCDTKKNSTILLYRKNRVLP